VIEALILGGLIGLWLVGKVHVHPVVGIVGAVGAMSGYGYLYTRTRLAKFMAAIATVFWILLAVTLTLGFAHDWLWAALAAAVMGYISWKAHRWGAEELRSANR
jgi:hypothetical protein